MEGASIESKLSQKKGFTIVEIMVVMAIMAAMAILGVSAMIGVSDGVIADRVAESVLTQIREAQNKALSVASVQIGSGAATEKVYPVAWGVTVSKGDDGNGVESFYILAKDDGSYTRTPVDSENTIAIYDINSFTTSGGLVEDEAVSFVYVAPFGKYTATLAIDPCAVDNPSPCTLNDVRPYNLQVPDGLEESVDVGISFRGRKRTITVGSNGEVGLNG